jgi:hypothetical protein
VTPWNWFTGSVQTDYSDKKQVALFLIDDDLVKMINLKIEGKSPTLLIEDRYYEFLEYTVS